MAYQASSGHHSLANTPLARIGYHSKIVANGYEKDFLQLIVSDEIDSAVARCNQVVQIQRQARAGPWRRYETNQQLVADQIAPEAFCFTLCNNAYKSIKFDKLDIARACDRWNDFETGFLEDSWQELARAWREYVLDAMVLEASRRNKGVAAGRNCNINLGGPGVPRAISGATLAAELVHLKQALVESRRWIPGEMFLILPPALMTALVNSPYANAMNMGNCVDCSLLKSGEMPGQVMGFTVIETNEASMVTDPITAQPVYNVIAGHKGAFAFVGDIIEGEIAPVSDSFGLQYKMLATWGGKAIMPDALAVGYWSI
jgi:hypothetical protein